MITIVWDEDTYYNNDGGDPEEEWSYRGTTSTHMSNFRAVYSKGDPPPYKGWGNSDSVALDAAPGDLVLAVMVQYSTGDTFGHDAGKYLTILDVFREGEEDKAYGLEKAAEDFTQIASSLNGVAAFQFEYGGRQYHAGWTGYFESMDRCWTEHLTVGNI